jgi:hypothetical protein
MRWACSFDVLISFECITVVASWLLKKRKRHITMQQHKPTAITLLIAIAIVGITTRLACPANGTEIMYEGDETRSHIVSPLPYTYLEEDSLPQSFDWGRVDGGKRSLLTHMLNQHIPQVRVSRFVCHHVRQLFVVAESKV